MVHVMHGVAYIMCGAVDRMRWYDAWCGWHDGRVVCGGSARMSVAPPTHPPYMDKLPLNILSIIFPEQALVSFIFNNNRYTEFLEMPKNDILRPVLANRPNLKTYCRLFWHLSATKNASVMLHDKVNHYFGVYDDYRGVLIANIGNLVQK